MAIILVVDDEIGIRELLSEILMDEGHDVRLAENAAAARRIRNELRPDLVLLDIWMPDTDGISLLKEWHGAGFLNMPVVMMSGHGTIDTAVEAVRFGASDFLEKPIALQRLLATVHKALKQESRPRRPPLTLEAFSRSAFIKDFRRRLEQAASRTRALFIRGASGGLAEICARTLLPPRGAWMDLSEIAAPLTQDMLQKVGGGLVFIPDLAALGKLQQMNLLFALDRVDKLNILLVAASSRPLPALAEAGWDSKLLNRLGEIWVLLLSLAAHVDDVPEIATVLLTHFIERGEVPARHFSSAALDSLRTLPWKRDPDGSWSGLYALVKNLALNTLEESIGSDDVARLVPEEADEGTTALEGLFGQPLRDARDAFERAYLEYHLRLEGGNMTRLAEKSGLERTHLYRKLKQLGVVSARKIEE